MLDLSTDTPADLDPEIHLIVYGECSGKLHRNHLRSVIICRNASNQKAAIVWATVAHHIPALSLFHICRCKITIEHLCQMIAIRIINSIRLGVKVVVNRLAIGMHNRRNILRTLHAPFDFERINARIKQLRNEFDCIQIAR